MKPVMYRSLNRTVILLCGYRACIKKLQGLIKQNRSYLGRVDKVVLKLIPERMIGVDDYQQYLKHTNEQMIIFNITKLETGVLIPLHYEGFLDSESFHFEKF